MNLTIIGIDCATDSKKTGLARATYSSGNARLCDAEVGGADREKLEERVANWIVSSTDPVLLALDAPLGWPVGLRDALVAHSAGEPIRVDVNQMVRRGTDRLVSCMHKKTPLDVGADRIARTAYWAVNFLGTLRKRTEKDIRLAWLPSDVKTAAAIEVYPAATMMAYKVTAAEYKKPQAEKARRKMVSDLQSTFKNLELNGHEPAMIADADVLDAVVCVAAALDFLEDRSAAPSECALGSNAKTEGWIWAPRRPHKDGCMCQPHVS